MVINESFLQSDKPVVPYRSLLRIDVDDAQFAHTRMVEVEGRSDAELKIRRLIGRVALDQRHSHNFLLAEERLPIPAEGVVGAPSCRGHRGDRGGDTRRLIQRVADRAQIEEPVLTEN